ncbi:hypothetical protein [Undibacterium sp. SXout20W]|uniref:hypothetical protein n=1 Tax=Undibacterium sp. SXout20W TaxID=3413051 RepID=UPI003BF5EBEF
MYAIVGAQVLTMLTGTQCTAVCGGQIMDCGSDQYVVISPNRKELRSARKLSEISNYHCWIQVSPVDKGDTSPVIIDFTLRHDSYCAKLLKKPFNRCDLLPFLWEGMSYFDKPIPQELRHHPHLKDREYGWLWRNAHCEKLLQQYIADNRAHFSLLSSLVLDTFANRIERLNS